MRRPRRRLSILSIRLFIRSTASSKLILKLKTFVQAIPEAASIILVKMEDYLKRVLQTGSLERFGSPRRGCISSGYGYRTDKGLVFVKTNSKSGSDIIFDGEFRGLKEIRNTETVKVPEPISTGKYKSEHYIIMSYYDIKPLKKYLPELGTCLAELHLQNITQLKSDRNFVGKSYQDPISEFGFHVPTCCGHLEQNNEWCKSWVEFYTNQKLLPQIKMAERKRNCKEVGTYWSELVNKIPKFFENVVVEPSLLHGDLWIGNTGETNDGAIVFDPAAFYGHHEYDLAIAGMFGGFGKEFYRSYHELIPKQPGFEERHNLYQLFHHLNHWNHFGDGYRGSTLSLMRKLLDVKS